MVDIAIVNTAFCIYFYRACSRYSKYLICSLSGHTPQDTATLVYQPLPDYTFGPCSGEPFACAAVPIVDLDWAVHADHEYYMSIKAKNTAGLDVVGISMSYRHSIQLPSRGVVLDMDPESIDMDPESMSDETFSVS